METKTCTKCNKSKYLSDFREITVKGKSKKRAECIQCESESNKRYINKQRSKWFDYHKKYYADNQRTLHGRIQQWKSGAMKRNLEWSIDEKYLNSLPMICFYTNIPLTMEVKHTNTLSLDRIDSSKGYTKDNVVFCCAIINSMKNTLSVVEFINFCKMISNNSENIMKNIN